MVTPSTATCVVAYTMIVLHLCQHSLAQTVPQIPVHMKTYAKVPLLSKQNQTRGCPLATLDARLAAVNKVCCFARSSQPGSNCSNQSALACDVDCAMLLVPLLHDCRPILDLLYDPLDKVRDGHAAIFDMALSSCHTIPTQVVLDELVQLHKKKPKVCTEKVLNNVAKTKVLPPPCVDVNPQCAAGIRVNFLTCGTAAGMCDKTCKVCTPAAGIAGSKHHVCRDQNPRCAAAIKVGFISCATQKGICDKTCKQCTAQGGHRRVQHRALAHRRAQGFQMLTPCKLASFATEMNNLNQVCCDEPGICKTGVPKTCDAKCAVTFVEFYNRCHRELGLRVAENQMLGFKQLYDTCSNRLPAAELLRAVATCRAPLPIPFENLTKADGLKVLAAIKAIATPVQSGSMINWDGDSTGYVSDGGGDMCTRHACTMLCLASPCSCHSLAVVPCNTSHNWSQMTAAFTSRPARAQRNCSPGTRTSASTRAAPASVDLVPTAWGKAVTAW
eukprot:COSAG01_NODE_2855_length_6961_cov_3.612260_3_plen_500_part_00